MASIDQIAAVAADIDETMCARKTFFVLIAGSALAASSIFFFWQWLTTPRQSTVRLSYYLHLKELRIAIDSYEKHYQKLPQNMEELARERGISEASSFACFQYIGDSKGVLAFQRKPFRAVKKGEPWGGHGEVAKNDIPAARLLLFADGVIEFVDESEFQEKFRGLSSDSKIP